MQVKFEAAAPVGNKQSFGEAEKQPLFPHLYGTIDMASVQRTVAMLRDDASGSFLGIAGL